MSPSGRVAIFCIHVYQYLRVIADGALYSIFGVVSTCKHSPSCSQYTQDMIKKHGTIVGLKKGLRQILSCR